MHSGTHPENTVMMEETQFQSGVWRIEEPNEAKFNQSDEKGLWEPKPEDILAIFEKLEQCSGGPIPLKWVCPGRKPPEKQDQHDDQADDGMDVDGEDSKEEELRAPEMSAFDFDEFQSDVNAKLTPRATSGGLGRTPRPEKRVAKMDNIMDSLRKQQLQRVAEREARRKGSPGTPPGRSRLLNFKSPGPKASLSKPGWSSPSSKSESPPRTGINDVVTSGVPMMSMGDMALRNDNGNIAKSLASSIHQQDSTLDARVSELTIEPTHGSASRPDSVSISLPDCDSTLLSEDGSASRSDGGSALRPDNGSTSVLDAGSTSMQDGGSGSRSDGDSNSRPGAVAQNSIPEQNLHPSPEVSVREPTDSIQTFNSVNTSNNGVNTSNNDVNTSNNGVSTPNNPFDSMLVSVSTTSSNCDSSNTTPRASDSSSANTTSREQSSNVPDSKTPSNGTNKPPQLVVDNGQPVVGHSSPPLVTVTSIQTPPLSSHSTSTTAVPDAHQPTLTADHPITGEQSSDPVPVPTNRERDNATVE